MDTPTKNLVPDQKFSPVTVAVSPVVKVQGNLTGTVRQVRDSAAELYNLVQRWNNLVIQGLDVLQDIVRIMLPTLTGNSNFDRYPEGLNKICEQLDSTYLDLATVVKSMKCLVQQFKGLRKLEELRKNGAEPLFITWTPAKFESEIEAICTAYEEELKVKELIKQSICHSESEDDLQSFIPLWTQQCCVDETTNFRIEAMLKETGHR